MESSKAPTRPATSISVALPASASSRVSRQRLTVGSIGGFLHLPFSPYFLFDFIIIIIIFCLYLVLFLNPPLSLKGSSF